MDDPARNVRVAPTEAVERLGAVANSLANSADISDALEWLAGSCSHALGARVSIFEATAQGWMLAGQGGGRIRASLSDLDRALTAIPAAPVALVDLRASGEGLWTSVAIDRSGAMPTRMLVAGDWSSFQEELTAFGIALSFAQQCAHEKSGRQRAERALLRGYRMGRRLSRRGDLDTVCRRLVDEVARDLAAERVALALYRPEVDRLVIAATHGYPASSVKDVRIEPGSWVVGHVYQTGRPVFVRDIVQIRRTPVPYRQYRTNSFVAVPLSAGSETIGVLSATDKSSGSPFEPSDAAALRSFSVTAALAIAAARSNDEVNRLSYAATADTLTALFNRSYFDTRLHEELERARRAGTSLTVLMLDIDDFKKINDTYGHQVGDAILQAVGNILRSTVRVFDICARFGGDEFAILMPTSDQERGAASAERIRQRVWAHTAFPSGPRLTLSIGVALSREDDTPADIVRRADRLLYKAKAEGKNRVCASSDDTPFGRMPVVHDNSAGRA